MGLIPRDKESVYVREGEEAGEREEEKDVAKTWQYDRKNKGQRKR